MKKPTIKRVKTKKNDNIYRLFADVYDRMSADAHSLRMVPYTMRILRRFKFHGSRGLDLCCGSGSATLALAEEGLQMYGLDGSPSMLKHARAKLGRVPRALAKKIRFTQGILPDFASARGLKAGAPFDLVTCYYDSLNYMLTPEDLEKTFATVSRIMSDGGLFVFDMNTLEALKTLWGEQVYAGTEGNLAWIWKNQFFAQDKMAEARTTFFVRQPKSQLCKRFEELHSERAYSLATVKKLLKKAGLQPLAAYRCYGFSKALEKDLRICFVARKIAPK